MRIFGIYIFISKYIINEYIKINYTYINQRINKLHLLIKFLIYVYLRDFVL